MKRTGSSLQSRPAPDVSIVMPCYNEAAIVEYTVRRLVAAFEERGWRLELIAVDNGSTDLTGEILSQLERELPALVKHRVERNQGYGFGVISGLPRCSAAWLGIIPADGQVDAEDVVRLFEAAVASDGWIVAKVRRRFRMDGLWRKVVSVSYNLFVRALWPRLGSIDINGSPKLFPRRAYEAMDLQSKDWLLDPEIMIKAHSLGLRVLELNVFARMRGNGLSHVRATTCWTFFRRLVEFRTSRSFARWHRDVRLRSLGTSAGPLGTAARLEARAAIAGATTVGAARGDERR
jgi:glycosyltransferase involved in cell wall biosynthesis